MSGRKQKPPLEMDELGQEQLWFEEVAGLYLLQVYTLSEKRAVNHHFRDFYP